MPVKQKNIRKALLICLCLLFSVHSAESQMVWPVLDATGVSGFIAKISSQINKVTASIGQVTTSLETIAAVGDQAQNSMKYAKKFKEQAKSFVGDAITLLEDSQDLVKESDKKEEENIENSKEIVNETVNIVEVAVENGVTGDELQNIITDAKNEIIASQDKLDDDLNMIQDEVIEVPEETEELDDGIEEIIASEESIQEGDKKEISRLTQDLKADFNDWKDKVKELISNRKEQRNTVINEKILTPLNGYAKIVDDYSNQKIDKKELKKAGENLVTISSSAQLGNTQKISSDFKNSTQNLIKKVNNIKETLSNIRGNNKTYQDEDDLEPTNGDKTSFLLENEKNTYAFSYREFKENILLTGIYSKDKRKLFLMSKELACDESSATTDFVDSIEKNSNNLRKCLIKAMDIEDNKYENSLYKPYKEIGVMRHIQEDYIKAGISASDKGIQYALSWDNEKNSSSPFNQLKNLFKNIQNSRNSYSLLTMIEIERPKFLSEIMRVDSLQNAKEAISVFSQEKAFLSDREYSIIADAKSKKLGALNNTQLISDVFLYNCKLDIKDFYDENRKNKNMGDTETGFFDCLLRYATGATRGIEQDDSGNPIASDDVEHTKEKWSDYISMSLQDGSLKSIETATRNINKAMKTMIADQQDGKSIPELSKTAKEASDARGDYVAAAEISYFSTLQMYDMIEGDATALQAKLLYELRKLNYNDFGKDLSIKEENKK